MHKINKAAETNLKSQLAFTRNENPLPLESSLASSVKLPCCRGLDMVRLAELKIEIFTANQRPSSICSRIVMFGIMEEFGVNRTKLTCNVVE